MFKIGDRVICIDPGNISYSHINSDYTYIVQGYVNFRTGREKGIRISINNGTKSYYKISRFISLKEQRNKKLKQLQNENKM